MPAGHSFVGFRADDAQRLDWSPDGRWIALGGAGQLRLVDASDGTSSWQVSARAADSVTFSPEGQRIAACDTEGESPSIAMHDVTSGNQLWIRSQELIDLGLDKPLDPKNPVGSLIGTAIAGGLAMAALAPFLQRQASVHFSPDGRLVAHAGLVLDAVTGEDAVSLPTQPRASGSTELTLPMAPAFSRDSRMLAVRTLEGIGVLDAHTGQALWSAPCPDKPVWAHFTASHLVVACDPALEIIRFDASTGTQVARQPLSPPIRLAIPFVDDLPALYDATPDGRSTLAVGGSPFSSTTATVYDVSTGSARFPVVKLKRNESAGLNAGRGILSPLGDTFAVNRPGLTVLRTRSGTTVWEEPDVAVADVGFHPNGSKLAAIVDDQLRVYDTGLMASPISVGAPATAVSVSGGALPLLAAGSQHEDGHGIAYLFQATQGTIVLEKRDQGLIKAARLSPDGHLLATGRTSGVVAIYDTVSGNGRTMRPGGAINDLAFDDTGGLLATVSRDKTARLIETATGSERWNAPHRAPVTHVVLDPQGRWMVTACDDHVTVLETGSGNVTAEYPTEGQVITGKVRALSAARDRPLVAAAYDGDVVLVIDAAAGTLIGQVGHPRPPAAAALNAPGDLLASGGRDNTIRISAVSTDEVATLLSVPTGSEVIGLAFNPSDGLLAAATADGVVRVLEPGSGDELVRLCHPQAVTGITFSRDGSLLAVGCEDGFVYVYPARWS